MTIAQTRIYQRDARGVRRLIATPGDVIPSGVPSAGVVEQHVDPPEAAVEPLEGYNGLTEEQVLALLPSLDEGTLKAVQAYERTHDARGSITGYEVLVAVVTSVDGKTSEEVADPLQVPAVSVTEGYDGLNTAALEAEIDRRNEDREDASKVVPVGTGANGAVKNADRIAALQADDAKTDEG